MRLPDTARPEERVRTCVTSRTTGTLKVRVTTQTPRPEPWTLDTSTCRLAQAAQ